MTASTAPGGVPAAQGSSNIVAFPGRVPERLVGLGFRCWLRGLSTGDIASWEKAFDAFSAELGPERAKALLIDLSQFVRAVRSASEREIEVVPDGVCSFCRDECLAISIVAACQHGDRAALRSSAAALVGCDDIGDTIAGAQTLAGSLKASRLLLAMDSICPAACPLRQRRDL